jgi:prevent-host-death family protein
MHIVPLSEFRANASAMLDLVEKGETVRIMRHGKPVADLVPVPPEAVDAPSYLQPFEPLRYERPPSKTGAQMIIEARESGW